MPHPTQDQPSHHNQPPTQNLPTTPNQSSSTYNRPARILVPATEENQRIYNQIQEQIRLSRNSHAASETQQERDSHFLRPPESAPPMARSPTTESGASSTYSGSEDPHAASPTHETAAAEVRNGGRRPRGKRKGQLNPETRLNTHVKRKLKLVCEKHRVKKTSVSQNRPA